jgi:hypothetical protein
MRLKVALESRQRRPALPDVPDRLGGSAFLRMEMAFVQGAIEIVSRLRQSLCIAADAVTPAVIALILDLQWLLASSRRGGGSPQ